MIATIGGYHSCHLLKLLDYELVRGNPKIFMGFSDMTGPNVAIWHKTGLVTFNGPALLPDGGEYPRIFDCTKHYFRKALCDPRPIRPIEPSPWWAEEFLDWSTKQDLTRRRERRESPGWTWLKGRCAEGVLIGGPLESLEHLRGTHSGPTGKMQSCSSSPRKRRRRSGSTASSPITTTWACYKCSEAFS